MPWGDLEDVVAELRGAPTERRARRAIERQLEYQHRKAARIAASAEAIEPGLARRTQALCARLAAHCAIDASTRVLEVGSGAHGHVFFLPPCDAIGVDPLADHYRSMFPWQTRARTLAAAGEALPFAAGSMDLVLCDNVVDHARDPAAILAEIVRVLRPGGLLYFTVHVHHGLHDCASRTHGALSSLRVPLEIGPFADHTVHFREHQVRRLVRRLPLTLLDERVTPPSSAARPRRGWIADGAIDLLTRAFPKNRTYGCVAERRR